MSLGKYRIHGHESWKISDSRTPVLENIGFTVVLARREIINVPPASKHMTWKLIDRHFEHPHTIGIIYVNGAGRLDHHSSSRSVLYYLEATPLEDFIAPSLQTTQYGNATLSILKTLENTITGQHIRLFVGQDQ